MNKRHKTILGSAARTATVSVSGIDTGDAPAAYFVLDVTVDGAAASITWKVDYLDETSSKYINLLTGAAVADVGTTVYKISPALTAVANSIATEHLPQTLKVTVTHADADSITYSVGMLLL
jgi:uncharacterized protein YggE